jgi:outer membrane immunogenic protein
MRVATGFALCGLSLMGALQEASAQDYKPLPVLRGSDYRPVAPTYRNWSGFYAGGSMGYSSASADFSESGNTLLARILENTMIENEFQVSTWPEPRDASNNASPWGIFLGYNWQSDNAVFGFEFAYNRTKHNMSGVDSVGRIITTSNEYQYDVTASAGASAKITDFATMKLRGGAVYGTVMPYVSGGLAVGKMTVVQLANVTYPAPTDVSAGGGQPALPGVNITRTDGKSNSYVLGLTIGGGFDWEFMPHLFLRGEYEYVGFLPVNDVSISIHTARAGVGLKF